jgi:hypothetical protein
MEAISFLCVPLGSSTVQLHDSLGSRRACACSEAGFGGQTGDRGWGWTTEEQAFCCAFFLWSKGLNAKDIHKEMFPVYVEKCLSRKAVHNWVAHFSLITEVRKWLRQQSTLLCCGFRRTGKAMGQVYQCWWRICREINVIPRFNITCFTFYIHLWPVYWLSLVITGLSGFGNSTSNDVSMSGGLPIWGNALIKRHISHNESLW